MNKIKILALGSLLFGLTGVASADVQPVEMIKNGQFTSSLNSWTRQGTTNRRAGNNVINTATGNAGFNSFFNTSSTQGFAVLGDDSGNISGTPNAGISSISQSFTLPPTQGGFTVSSYDLAISFQTAFNGDDSNSNNPNFKDIFSATLTNSNTLFSTTLFSQNSDPLPNCGPSTTCANNQLVNNPFNSTIKNLAPGIYTLTFTLNEAAGTGVNATNTAAGIDNVSILARANIPQPPILLLFGVGLLALRTARKPA